MMWIERGKTEQMETQRRKDAKTPSQEVVGTGVEPGKTQTSSALG